MEGALVIRWLLALLHHLGWHNLFALSLLWLATASAAAQLSELIRGFDLGLLLQFTTFGTLLGWLLARSSTSRKLAALAALSLSTLVVFAQVGRLAGKLLALSSALSSTEATLLWSRRLPDPSPVLNASADLFNASTTLVLRSRDWLLAQLQAQPLFDPVALMLVWGTGFCLIAAWMAFVVRRHHRPLPALLPLIALTGIQLFYLQVFPWSLLVLLGALLVLQFTLTQRAREQQWQSAGLDYSDEIRYDLALHAAPLVTGILFVALLLPSFSIYDTLRNVHAWFTSPVASPLPLPPWFGTDASPQPQLSPFEAVRVGGLPRQHLIGSGPELSRQVVMLVQTDDPPGDPPPPYYWRALTYDTYTGAGWVADEGETVAVAAGEPINQPSSAQRRVTQDVQFLSAFDGLLYAAGSLSAVDQDVRVARRASDDLFGAMLDTLTYRAQSLVPNVSAATLRSSGSLYPEPIRDRYLSLPDDAPTRVLSLARDLTATAPTPYDRARAITNYLRAFSYTLDLPAPPRNRDVVDYFLFDLQKGYCDYYATAMVVLARAAGLPARLVVGYASGAYDAANARYVVTAADAHSWPEVYFAGVGWIEFEPTPARPPFDYGGQIRPIPTTPPLTPSIFPRADLIRRIAVLLLGALMLGLLLSGLWFASEPLRLRRLPAVARARAIYARLLAHASRLDVGLHRGDTPYEVGSALARRLASLDGAASDDALSLATLIDLYVRAAFSPHRISGGEALHALRLWRRMRMRLWRYWLQHKITARKQRGSNEHTV